MATKQQNRKSENANAKSAKQSAPAKSAPQALEIIWSALDAMIAEYATRNAEPNRIHAPWSKYAFIDLEEREGALVLVIRGRDRTLSTTQRTSEKPQLAWNDETSAPRTFTVARAPLAMKDLMIAIQTQCAAFLAANTQRPGPRFALVTDPDAQRLLSLLLAAFPYNNQQGGAYSAIAQEQQQKSAKKIGSALETLATVKANPSAMTDDMRKMLQDLLNAAK